MWRRYIEGIEMNSLCAHRRGFGVVSDTQDFVLMFTACIYKHHTHTYKYSKTHITSVTNKHTKNTEYETWLQVSS